MLDIIHIVSTLTFDFTQASPYNYNTEIKNGISGKEERFMWPINERETNQVMQTKRRIYESFSEMLSNKPFSDITVGQICKKADVSRSVFYNHYKNKEDVLLEIFNRIMLVLEAKLEKESAKRKLKIRDLYNIFCVFLWRNRVFFINLHNHHFSCFLTDFLIEAHNDFFRFFENSIPPDTAEYKNYFVKYHANALAFLFLEWLQEDDPIPPEEIADIALCLNHRESYIRFVQRNKQNNEKPPE